MKVFVAVTKEQALKSAELLLHEARQMSSVPGEAEIAIVGIEVHDTVPEGRLTPRSYPCSTDQRLPPGWRNRVKECGAGRDG